MGKRGRNESGNGNNRKKYKVANGIIDPSTSGIYATCNRRQEKRCRDELKILFEEKLQEYYKDELANGVVDDSDQEEEEISIEESIKRELDGLKNKQKDVTKKEPIQFIDLGCECVVFIKTRKPIDPEFFVEKICQESFESKVKNTRYTQKLSPVTYSASASIEELAKLAQRVLKPHFHKEEGQEPVTFAIKVTTRNFNTLTKGEIIQKVAESVGRDHGHKVDLKQYEKLILVECFKNNIGMSVVNNYEKYQKYNLQQIFDKQLQDEESNDLLSRTHGAQESKVTTEENKTETIESKVETTEPEPAKVEV